MRHIKHLRILKASHIMCLHFTRTSILYRQHFNGMQFLGSQLWSGFPVCQFLSHFTFWPSLNFNFPTALFWHCWYGAKSEGDYNAAWICLAFVMGLERLANAVLRRRSCRINLARDTFDLAREEKEEKEEKEEVSAWYFKWDTFDLALPPSSHCSDREGGEVGEGGEGQGNKLSSLEATLVSKLCRPSDLATQ